VLHSGPFVTKDIPGIGGRIKRYPEDFRVTEVLSRDRERPGLWALALVEKVNRTSFEMVQILAHHLQIDQRAISLAGMKDTRAVTRQFVALEGISRDAVRAVQLPYLHVLSVTTTDSPLRYGEHIGNRFDIRVREVDRSREEALIAILDNLSRNGLPNFYGPQRFGSGYEGALVGKGLLLGDHEAVVWRLLGWHGGRSNNQCAEARRLFSKGDWASALRAWPRRWYEKRRMLDTLIETEGDFQASTKRIPSRLKRLYLMGYQSHIFNLCLTARLEGYFRLLEGDIPSRDTGEEPCPTGPIFGPNMPLPSGMVLDLECRLLAEEGFSLKDLLYPSREGNWLHGSRRPFAVALREVAYRWDGSDLLLHFMLPPGSYATVLLGEITKIVYRAAYTTMVDPFIRGKGRFLGHQRPFPHQLPMDS